MTPEELSRITGRVDWSPDYKSDKPPHPDVTPETLIGVPDVERVYANRVTLSGEEYERLRSENEKLRKHVATLEWERDALQARVDEMVAWGRRHFGLEDDE